MRKSFTSLLKRSSLTLALAAAAFAPWQSADAQTRLLDENFDYPAGNLYQQGGWIRYGANTAAPIQVSANGGLTYAGYQDEAVGGTISLANTASGEDLCTFFKDEAKITSGEVYASFLLNVINPNTDKTGAYFVCWFPQTSKGFQDGGTGTECYKLFAGKGSDENHYKLGITISKAAANAKFTEQEFETGTTYLVVLRGTIVDGSGNDIYELWVNPATNALVAPEADVKYNEQESDPSMKNGGLCAIEMRQGRNSSNNIPDCTIDALRVATTWADLFPEQQAQATPVMVVSPSQGRLGQLYAGMQGFAQTTLVAQNLTGDVTVTCPEGVTCDKTVITAEEAMNPDGVILTFTVTAPSATGDFDKTVTFSSEEAEDVTFTLSGEVLPVTNVANSTQVNTLFADGMMDDTYRFTGKAVVTAIEKTEYGYGTEYNIYAHDMFGGICLNSAFFELEEAPLAIGDEISDFFFIYNDEARVPTLAVIPIDLEGTFAKVGETGKTKTPTDITLADVTETTASSYVHHLVKVPGLRFDGVAEGAVFEAGKKYNVTDGDKSAKVNVLNGSDLLGQAVPTGTVTLTGISGAMDGLELRLRSLADIEVGAPVVQIAPESLFDFTSNAVAIDTDTEIMQYTVTAENLPQAVPVVITGTDAGMFEAVPSEVPAGTATTVVKIMYHPTEPGMHKAGVFFDFDAINPELNYTHQFPVSKAYNPQDMPVITISPAILELETTPGVPVTATATLTSSGTFDYITATRSGNGDNGGITINNTYMPAGSTDVQLTVTFTPKEEGEYTETWTYTSTMCDTPATLTVKAKCTGDAPVEEQQGDPELKVDWSNPYPYYTQDFADVAHNEPLKLEGWCNHAIDGTRAWWGYTGANGDEFTAAKVTAYDSSMKPGEGSDGITVLLSPALDFKNATDKHLKFRLMGMYLTENSGDELTIGFGEPNPDAAEGETNLSLYDMDGFAIPATADEAGKWVEYDVDMSVVEDMPDTFCIAFTFSYTRGADNPTTYYITDFQWGNKDNSVDSVMGDTKGFAPDADGWYNVYNAQGMRVLRTKDAADIKALPAGIYLSRGAKHIIK